MQANGVIEFPEPLLMQHHESHAGNRLGHRINTEERVHCHCCLVVDACKACALECGNLAVTREQPDHTGDILVGNDFGHRRV